MLPPWMKAYIHRQVGTRAAYTATQTMYQLELGKSEQLVRIEDRYRTDQIKKIERSKHL